jgi:hypothetical protein
VAAQPQPVVFRPRSRASTAIWAVLSGGLTIVALVFVLTNLGFHLAPSPGLASAVVIVVVIALLNRARPIGLERTGLHLGSPDDGYFISWSNMTGVVALPRNVFLPERIRVGIADTSLLPGYWARRWWGVRVLADRELEVPLGYGQSGAEIADEIRHFIDAYG